MHQGKKLPPNIDENAEEGDVSDEDSADEMEDDCKLMNGDVCTLFVLFLTFTTEADSVSLCPADALWNVPVALLLAVCCYVSTKQQWLSVLLSFVNFVA